MCCYFLSYTLSISQIFYKDKYRHKNQHYLKEMMNHVLDKMNNG